MKRARFRLWVVGLGLCVLAFSAVAGAGVLSGGPERGLGPPPEPSPVGAGDEGNSVATPPNPDQSPWFRVYDRPLRVVASDSGLSLAFAYHPGHPGYRLPDQHWVFVAPRGRALAVSPASYEERVYRAEKSEWDVGLFKCGARTHVWNRSQRGGPNRAVLSPLGDRLALGDDACEGVWVTDLRGSSPPRRITSPVDRSVFTRRSS